MSSEPPSYSSIAERDLPKYSDVVTNILPLPPPPYVDPTGHFATTNLSIYTLPPISVPPNTPNWFFENRYKLIWISFFTLISILHLVLFVVIFQCPLPTTSLPAIQAFLFLHIIFIVFIIISCWHKYKLKVAFTWDDCWIAGIACFGIPVVINVLLFIYFTFNDMNELNNVIQGPIITNNTYSCSLSFYKTIFAVVILNYTGIPAFMIIMLTIYACVLVLLSSPVQYCLQCCFPSTTTQEQPRNTGLTPYINSTWV